jgi:hypothetical protein
MIVSAASMVSSKKYMGCGIQNRECIRLTGVLKSEPFTALLKSFEEAIISSAQPMRVDNGFRIPSLYCDVSKDGGRPGREVWEG